MHKITSAKIIYNLYLFICERVNKSLAEIFDTHQTIKHKINYYTIITWDDIIFIF